MFSYSENDTSLFVMFPSLFVCPFILFFSALFASVFFFSLSLSLLHPNPSAKKTSATPEVEANPDEMLSATTTTTTTSALFSSSFPD